VNGPRALTGLNYYEVKDEETNFGGGFARHDFDAGLVGAGYSPLPPNTRNVNEGPMVPVVLRK
jgi:hypothetical protein